MDDRDESRAANAVRAERRRANLGRLFNARHIAFVGGRNVLYPLQVGYQKHGESGIEISDWFPHTARHVDKLSIVRSTWTTDSHHGAQTQFHSGRHSNACAVPNLGACGP